MLGYPLALQLAAAALEPEETSTLAWLSLNITLGIIRHGYKLLDVDGAPTKWGRYDPAALNNDPSWADERGLNSLQIVAHVLAAHRLSEWLGRLDLSAELADAFEHLLLHGYHLNLLNQKIDSPSEINFSDDELSYAPYLSLHFSCVEAPPAATAALCRRVADPLRLSIQRSWAAIVGREHSALYSFVYAISALGDAPARAADAAALGVASLERYPTDLVSWPTDNSARLDLRTDGDQLPANNWSSTPIPRDETDALRWSNCPFERSASGDGLSEEDPTHFVLAYWLGRWHHDVQVPRSSWGG